MIMITFDPGPRDEGSGSEPDTPSPPRPAFAPGFRISAFDLAVLIAGAAVSAALFAAHPWTGIAAAFVVAHFFLFCNVIRMSRPLELIWATAFALLATAAACYGIPTWPTVLIASCVLTLALAAVQIRSPAYHGVGWRAVNPRLPEWWADMQRRRT